MYQIIAKSKYWLIFSAVIVALAIAAIAVWGLRFGIDFTGGSVLEARYAQDRPATDKIKDSLSPLGLDNLIVQPVGDNEIKLRFQEVDEAKHQEILSKLGELSPKVDGQLAFEELRYDSIEPSVGRDLRSRLSFWCCWRLLLMLLGLSVRFLSRLAPGNTVSVAY